MFASTSTPGLIFEKLKYERKAPTTKTSAILHLLIKASIVWVLFEVNLGKRSINNEALSLIQGIIKLNSPIQTATI